MREQPWGHKLTLTILVPGPWSQTDLNALAVAVGRAACNHEGVGMIVEGVMHSPTVFPAPTPTEATDAR